MINLDIQEILGDIIWFVEHNNIPCALIAIQAAQIYLDKGDMKITDEEIAILVNELIENHGAEAVERALTKIKNAEQDSKDLLKRLL